MKQNYKTITYPPLRIEFLSEEEQIKIEDLLINVISGLKMLPQRMDSYHVNDDASYWQIETKLCKNENDSFAKIEYDGRIWYNKDTWEQLKSDLIKLINRSSEETDFILQTFFERILGVKFGGFFICGSVTITEENIGQKIKIWPPNK